MNVFGDLPGWIRRFEWTPPDGVRVTQVQLYAVVDGRGYTATATAPSASFGRFERDLFGILETIVRRTS